MPAILDRLYNLHWVTDGVARSAQPYLGFYRTFLGSHGFRGVINLRGENAHQGWWWREKRICEELGIRHFDVRLSSRKLPLPDALKALFEAYDSAPLPLLLKCSGGQDRTSFAAALYLLQRKGAGAIDEAERQFAAWPYLHLPKRHQDWLKLFPRFALEDAGSMGLSEWAAKRYDPGAFSRWLAARGIRNAHGGVQQPTPLRKLRKPT